MKRKCAVSGQFYPSGERELRALIESFTPAVEAKVSVLGALCPHAGYVFSGAVAGEVFSRIYIPSTVVVLTPSHNFFQPPFALWTGGAWETPLGPVRIDAALNEELGFLDSVTSDNRVHLPEHAGEVILPFLQYHRPDVKISVLCIAGSASEASLIELGNSLACCLKKAGRFDALVVASSDMSHEQGPSAAETVNDNDPKAIEKMQCLDSYGLVKVCREEGVSMCGALPAAVMMESVKKRGGVQGRLIKRATSAESPYGRGDYVVGYAGMIFM